MRFRSIRLAALMMAWTMMAAPAYASRGEGLGALVVIGLCIIGFIGGSLLGLGVGLWIYLRQDAQRRGAIVAGVVSLLATPLLTVTLMLLDGRVGSLFQRDLPELIGIASLLSLAATQAVYWLLVLIIRFVRTVRAASVERSPLDG